jgi:hypothetical protein
LGSSRRFRQRHKQVRFSALRFVHGRFVSIHDEKVPGYVGYSGMSELLGAEGMHFGIKALEETR